jgi:hypothetical protein
MDTNDKTNEVKIRLSMAYGIKSFEKEVK